MPRGMKKGAKMMGSMTDPRARFFMALASDQRLRILQLLKEGEKNSQEIISELLLDPSVVSRHIMMLRNVGLVEAYKQGVTMYFKIADPRVFDIIELATNITRDWLSKFNEFF
ncbi:MAG TPA: ArsR family transcriptional regulator [Caldithrix abyssi]|uniref:ArsR family transcriptional regulator n=1 Tax=Caldithrix abyssi TaxID=187145 RepID=A0A7V5LJM6_CALAY|nr:winged helix-turn-helix transcriptional regulator [Caldisericaceae bacterium]HHE55902.1 ArsR family transcriptional regulator [Caldithrix abyssi]